MIEAAALAIAIHCLISAQETPKSEGTVYHVGYLYMSDSSTTPEKRLKFETSLCMATESFLCIWNDPWFNMYPLLDFKCRTGRKYWPRYEFLAAQPLFTAHIQKSLNIFLYKRKMFLYIENIFSYKTQCLLCKRLAGPIIPLAWSGKGFHFTYWRNH